jgi:hypothetical protein
MIFSTFVEKKMKILKIDENKHLKNNVDTLRIRRFKISKNILKTEGGATGSTTFQNEVKM